MFIIEIFSKFFLIEFLWKVGIILIVLSLIKFFIFFFDYCLSGLGYKYVIYLIIVWLCLVIMRWVFGNLEILIIVLYCCLVGWNVIKFGWNLYIFKLCVEIGFLIIKVFFVVFKFLVLYIFLWINVLFIILRVCEFINIVFYNICDVNWNLLLKICLKINKYIENFK